MILTIAVIIIALDLLIRLVLRPRGKSVPPQPTSYLRILVNIGAAVALAAAFYTSYGAPATGLTGDVLIRHVTVAPAFALTAVAVTLFWADRNRFAPTDGVRLASPATWAIPLRKLFFWVAVALAIPTILSILAAMFPLFGTDDQQKLLQIHRTCAPLLAISGLLFTYFALVTWRQRSAD